MRNFILYPRVNTLQVLLRADREVVVFPVFSQSNEESAVQQRLGQREVVKVGRQHAEVVEGHGALDTVQTVGLIFKEYKRMYSIKQYYYQKISLPSLVNEESTLYSSAQNK